jgi:hypothetical protein
MSYHAIVALGIFAGLDLLIYAAWGSDAFWWTSFGACLLVFVIVTVEALRRRE